MIRLGRTGNHVYSWFLENLKLLLMMVNDWLCGRYRRMPWRTITAAAFALLYVLNPFDLVPDFIPLLGQIDDIAVLMLCLNMIGGDIRRYEIWRKGNDAAADDYENGEQYGGNAVHGTNNQTKGDL